MATEVATWTGSRKVGGYRSTMGQWIRTIDDYSCFRTGTVIEEGRVAYNYIMDSDCFKCFACVSWKESLTGEEKLLVTAMMLQIDGIKDVSEVLLRALIKHWKRNSISRLVDPMENDARFTTFLQKRMVRVAVHRIMDLQAEESWDV